MRPIQVAVSVPGALRNAVRLLAAEDCDPTTVILRAVEDYVIAAAKNQDNADGKYRDLVQALSTPVADLHLSARPGSALRMLNRYVYKLVQKPPTDLFQLPNFGNKSLKETKEKPATLGLTLGMTLEDDAYRAAVVATVAANIQVAKA